MAGHPSAASIIAELQRDSQSEQRVLAEVEAKRQKTSMVSIEELKELILMQQKNVDITVQAAAQAASAASTAVSALQMHMSSVTQPQVQRTAVHGGAGIEMEIPPTQPDDNAVVKASAVKVIDDAKKDKRMPEQIIKMMDKTTASFEKAVKKYIKSTRHLIKSEADAKFFEDNEKDFEYPKGVKAFVVQKDFMELDSEWSNSKENDYVISIKIPKGSSRGEVMMMTHWWTSRLIKQIDLEALREHRDRLAPGVQKEVFKNACRQCAREFLEKSAAVAPGLQPPQMDNIDVSNVDSKAEQLYNKMMAKISKEIDDEDERKVKEESNKRKLDEAIAMKQPANLLMEVIDSRIAEANGSYIDEDHRKMQKKDAKVEMLI